MQAANSAAKPQRGCHRRRRRRRGWVENYRLVIELCHLSRLPLTEMEWSKKGQRRRGAVTDGCQTNSQCHSNDAGAALF